MNFERLRKRYAPSNVRVLLVGESPPAGGTFFYAGNSNLFRYTKAAFEQAHQQAWTSHEQFLKFFQREGFYLDDLCLDPVNGLPNAVRRKCRHAGVHSLASRIARRDPNHVLVTPKVILPQVKRAIELAGSQADIHALPFPAMSWQQAYVDDLVTFLRCRSV